jgi:outer membrane receptor protein involved in Fe transport
MRLLFGSGYLYHPYISEKDPVTGKYYMKIDYNDSWAIPFYFRVDMGLTYKLDMKNKKDITFIVEVLNIFNKNNIASYNWYHVFPETRQPVGVPQMFSSRFLNVGAEMNF